MSVLTWPTRYYTASYAFYSAIYNGYFSAGNVKQRLWMERRKMIRNYSGDFDTATSRFQVLLPPNKNAALEPIFKGEDKDRLPKGQHTRRHRDS